MAAKEFEMASATGAGRNTPPQRFVLDTGLFQDIYMSKGEWRLTNVTRIPVVDEHNPVAGVRWIDAILFSDGYLRGTVKARSGEIHTVSVDVSNELAAPY